MIDNRQNFRLRKQMDVKWSIPSQKIEGRGIIFNISLKGMLFITDRLFGPEHGMSIDFKIDSVPAFPAQGTLVWFRKVQEAHYQCGIKFTKASQTAPWAQWMEDNIYSLADAQDNVILERYLSDGQERE